MAGRVKQLPSCAILEIAGILSLAARLVLDRFKRSATETPRNLAVLCRFSGYSSASECFECGRGFIEAEGSHGDGNIRFGWPGVDAPALRPPFRLGAKK